MLPSVEVQLQLSHCPVWVAIAVKREFEYLLLVLWDRLAREFKWLLLCYQVFLFMLNYLASAHIFRIGVSMSSFWKNRYPECISFNRGKHNSNRTERVCFAVFSCGHIRHQECSHTTSRWFVTSCLFMPHQERETQQKSFKQCALKGQAEYESWPLSRLSPQRT